MTLSSSEFDGWHVDSSSPVPLYYQIAELLRAWIETSGSGGVQAPPELQLVEALNVSRATVRKAVETLEAEGLLYRRRGLGTFVADPRLPRTLKLTSLWDDLVRSGHQVRSEVLERKVVQADDEVAEKLHIEPETAVIALKRLRFSDDRPFSVMRNWHPFALCTRLIEADLSQRSLYEVLRTDCGIVFRKARQTIRARLPTRTEARLLAIKPSSPVVRMTRQSFTTSGVAAEWADHVYPADLCEFETDLNA